MGAVGIFSSYYPPHMGGVELFSRNLAHELARRGHRVVVIAGNSDGAPPVEAELDEVEVHRLPLIDVRGRFPMPLVGSRAYRFHCKMIREIPFDGILVNTRFYPLSLMAVKFAREKGLTPVVVEHGSAHLTLGNATADAVIERYEHAITKRIMRYDPAFYGVSERAAAWLEHFSIRASGVIHNAIDARAFRDCASKRDFRMEYGIKRQEALVAYTGRLVPGKGAHELLEAARMLGASSSTKFVMAGDGPDKALLERDAPENVIFPGRISSSDVAALLMQADVFCFPSSYPEGLPTSLLEAAACGVYIISADVGGAREVVPSPEYGHILTDTQPDTVAAALSRTLADRVLMEAAAGRCKAHVENELSWGNSAESAARALGVE